MELQPETLFLGVSLLDRFLSKRSFKSESGLSGKQEEVSFVIHETAMDPCSMTRWCGNWIKKKKRLLMVLAPVTKALALIANISVESQVMYHTQNHWMTSTSLTNPFSCLAFLLILQYQLQDPQALSFVFLFSSLPSSSESLGVLLLLFSDKGCTFEALPLLDRNEPSSVFATSVESEDVLAFSTHEST